MPRRKRIPGWQKLNNKQKRLLEYPPTPETWVCQNFLDTGKCEFYNPGRQDKCSMCGYARGNKPVLLWKMYVEACNVVGIEPGRQLFKSGSPPLVRTIGVTAWEPWQEQNFDAETITRQRNGKTRTRTIKRKT